MKDIKQIKYRGNLAILSVRGDIYNLSRIIIYLNIKTNNSWPFMYFPRVYNMCIPYRIFDAQTCTLTCSSCWFCFCSECCHSAMFFHLFLLLKYRNKSISPFIFHSFVINAWNSKVKLNMLHNGILIRSSNKTCSISTAAILPFSRTIHGNFLTTLAIEWWLFSILGTVRGRLNRFS